VTRRRWIADQVSGNRAFLTGAHAAHLARVLRAGIGQEFDISIGNRVRRGRITSIDSERVELELGEEVPFPSPPRITLALAIFKFDRMEWAIEKCTELNATSIVPVIARRTEKQLAQAAEKRVERWRRIAREASEQARRVTPPAIGGPVKLDVALRTFADLRIALAEAEREVRLAEILRGHEGTSSLGLAIGPEGGWTRDELQLFGQAGWAPASLGATILRAETAAIAAVAVARSIMM